MNNRSHRFLPEKEKREQRILKLTMVLEEYEAFKENPFWSKIALENVEIKMRVLFPEVTLETLQSFLRNPSKIKKFIETQTLGEEFGI